MSDAFYIYTDQANNPITPWRDNEKGGTLFINDRPVENFISAPDGGALCATGQRCTCNQQQMPAYHIDKFLSH